MLSDESFLFEDSVVIYFKDRLRYWLLIYDISSLD